MEDKDDGAEGGGDSGVTLDDGGDGIIDNFCNPATVLLQTDVARLLNLDFGFDGP